MVCCVALVVGVTAVRAQEAAIPGIESAPINGACPVTGDPVGETRGILWGHTVGFATEAARGEFLASTQPEQRAFVVSHLEPVNTNCPIDGTPAAQCEAVTLYEGFAIACCDDRCAAKFIAWDPGPAGAFIRNTVAPINTAICPQTGDALVPDDPYYVTHQGRLMQLCCDYCLMEWQYQPSLRDGALMRALGIEPEPATIVLP